MATLDRWPAPGPSFVRERDLRIPGAAGSAVRVGMSHPVDLEDGWWGTFFWVADDDGVVPARAMAPAAGPPPQPPLAVLGPVFAGALSGLIAQEAGRQCLRLALPQGDADRPWQRPLLVRAAIKWEPMRAATLRPNELAREALEAFARAVAAAGRPG